MSSTKADRQMARDAGRHAFNEPPERRGVHACPFAEGTDERTAWLVGFRDAASEAPDPATLEAELSDALAANDSTGGQS